MSEVSGPKVHKLFGIVFFNSKKKAVFLGKKILRELIFEFDKIEFFYALHPIKMHTSSALLVQFPSFRVTCWCLPYSGARTCSINGSSHNRSQLQTRYSVISRTW